VRIVIAFTSGCRQRVAAIFSSALSSLALAMSKLLSARIRRTVLSLAIGTMVTGLFVSGLVWMTTLRERGWSNAPRTFDRQVTFVVTLLVIVTAGVVLNYAFSRRRNRALTSTTGGRSSLGTRVADHPLHDPFLDS
jgi:hypothetical protein